MLKSSAQKKLPKKQYPEEDNWDYLEEGILEMSRSACVCMTCVYFRYSCDRFCRTLLACKAHVRLIPQGAHLTSRCPLWHKNDEDEISVCAEAA